ncbi:MAG: bacterial Ig-like domain-containing protein, partial [Clostridia bacterium]|nr:bacterial Ig-like domain-containing protein [Clostridia bacterium]
MKKFLTLFLALAAMLTVFAVAVYAGDGGEETPEATVPEYTIYADGTLKHTVNVKSEYTGSESIIWKSNNDAVATVDEKTGVVTAVAPGNAKIFALLSSDFSKAGVEVKIVVVNRSLADIQLKQPKKTSYFAGDTIDLTGMVVTFVYDNGDQVEAKETEYKCDLTGTRLLTSHKEATIIAKVNEDIKKSFNITVKDNIVTDLKLSLSGGTSNFTAGNTLPGLNVTATFSDGTEAMLGAGKYDILINGEKVSSSRLLTVDDKNIAVYYNGKKSNVISISVTKPSDGSGDDDN